MDNLTERAMAEWRNKPKGIINRVYLVPGRALVYTRTKTGEVTITPETEQGFVQRRSHWKKAIADALQSSDKPMREWAIKVVTKLGEPKPRKTVAAKAPKRVL